MTEQEIKEFKRFLKENGAYSAFIRNYNPSFNGISRLDITLREYLEVISYSWVLTAGFGWSYTKEGYNYWAYLSKKWHAHVWEKAKLEYEAGRDKTV